MKAAVLYQPGGPENFIVEERAMPVPVGNWVRVKVMAFGLNRSELMTRKGYSPGVRLPRVLGIECVGIVDNDPEGIFRPGDKVAAFMGGMGRDFDGSYAEYTLLPRELLYPFESQLSWEILGAMPEMFQTVYGSLHTSLQIKDGEILLIRGGTSSIGMLAAQLAKNSGLTVIATTRRRENSSVLLSNGADHVLVDDGFLARQVKALYPDGVDKVLELVGTVTLADSLRCVAAGGKVCMTGMLAEQWAIKDFAPMEYIPAGVFLTVYDSGQLQVCRLAFQQFIKEVEEGQVRISIGGTFQLADITAAHQLMDSNTAKGKIVVLTNG